MLWWIPLICDNYTRIDVGIPRRYGSRSIIYRYRHGDKVDIDLQQYYQNVFILELLWLSAVDMVPGDDFLARSMISSPDRWYPHDHSFIVTIGECKSFMLYQWPLTMCQVNKVEESLSTWRKATNLQLMMSSCCPT